MQCLRPLRHSGGPCSVCLMQNWASAAQLGCTVRCKRVIIQMWAIPFPVNLLQWPWNCVSTDDNRGQMTTVMRLSYHSPPPRPKSPLHSLCVKARQVTSFLKYKASLSSVATNLIMSFCLDKGTAVVTGLKEIGFLCERVVINNYQPVYFLPMVSVSSRVTFGGSHQNNNKS